MVVYRTIQTSFWTDPDVDDNFTPEDKYFYLYLLTNPHTNICGCYEISHKQMSNETGYNGDTINHLLNRMTEQHKVIMYSKTTKEIFVINWHRYNWSTSKETMKGVAKVAEYIKNPEFRRMVFTNIEEYTNTPSRGSGDGIEASVSVSVSDTVTDSDTGFSSESVNKEDTLTELSKEIVGYLNMVTGSSYRYQSSKTQSLISARTKEGFTVDDFKTVIDKKYAQWHSDSKMRQYLRPETLFGTKFEGYLNQQDATAEDSRQEWIERWANV